MKNNENRLSNAYVQAVARAGAAPLLLPVCGRRNLWQEMLQSIDWLLLSGGGDPDAWLYGEDALLGHPFAPEGTVASRVVGRAP